VRDRLVEVTRERADENGGTTNVNNMEDTDYTDREEQTQTRRESIKTATREDSTIPCSKRHDADGTRDSGNMEMELGSQQDSVDGTGK
jgi:hypothetical protein